MKVTKYPQSCLLLEKANQRILIDPGNFFSAKFSLEALGDISVVLYTHRHGDHMDANVFEQVKTAAIPAFGNNDVCAMLGQGVSQIKSGQPFQVAGFNIMPHDIEHFKADPNNPPPQNTGYIIDGNFFHPGDGYKNNGVKVDYFAAPIAGPFGFDSVIEFIESVGARRVIPIHYSNQERYPCHAEEFKAQAQNTAEILLLQDGQSVDI